MKLIEERLRELQEKLYLLSKRDKSAFAFEEFPAFEINSAEMFLRNYLLLEKVSPSSTLISGLKDFIDFVKVKYGLVHTRPEIFR